MLKEAAEPVGGYLVYESRPMYADFRPITNIGSENIGETLDYMINPDYSGFPPRLGAPLGPLPAVCPPTPEISTVVAESEERIPKDGIWELVLPHRAPGETDALNYFVKGAVTPWINDPKFDPEPGKQHVLPATWRLVWEDIRYLDGIIPDESEYLADYASQEASATPNDHQPTAPDAVRIEANKTCPQTGYWYTPAKQNSRALFKQGDVMPDFPDSSYGATIWYWDQNQG